jgi:hypothetical protein
MSRYQVHYKCRPVGAQGTLSLTGTVYVNADDEDSARDIAIDMAYIESNMTIEHVTVTSCTVLPN